MTQQKFEASLRRTAEYEWACNAINEIKALKDRIASLEKSDEMKSEAGQLARIDLMKKRLDTP